MIRSEVCTSPTPTSIHCWHPLPLISRDGPSGDAGRVFIPRLALLARQFGLDAFDQEVLLICLAPEIDPRYERLFGYLHDDVTRRRPSIDLVARILESDVEERVAIRQRFGPHSSLMRFDLLRFIDDATQSPQMTRGLQIDERIVDYLLGSNDLEERLSMCARIETPMSDRADPIWPGGSIDQFARLLSRSRETRSNLTVYLHGSPGAAKLDFARSAILESGATLLVVEVAELLTQEMPSDVIDLAEREGRLIDAVLCFNGVDRLLTDDPAFTRPQRDLRHLVERANGPTILIGGLAGSPQFGCRTGRRWRLKYRHPTHQSDFGTGVIISTTTANRASATPTSLTSRVSSILTPTAFARP